MMSSADEARRQRVQLRRYLAWVVEEGGIEGPTRLDTIWKPHQQARIQWLKERCRGMVMELGCNWGWVLSYCGGHIGVDWNERSIELARILNPRLEFVVADVRDLPFPDGHVDTVMACEVLEHLDWPDVPKAVAEAQRVARARVLITIPNGEGDTAEATSMKHRWLLDAERRQAVLNMLAPWPWSVEWELTPHFFLAKAVRRWA